MHKKKHDYSLIVPYPYDWEKPNPPSGYKKDEPTTFSKARSGTHTTTHKHIDTRR